MEGKGCLFKKFAGIDVFDIELAENDPDKLIDMIAALEPTLGGVNLEDIKAPECFYIEREAQGADEYPRLPRRPARHGDHFRRRHAQWPEGRRQEDRRNQGRLLRRRRCRDFLSQPVVRSRRQAREHHVCDSKGVIYVGRPGGMDETKARTPSDTSNRTLAMRWSAPTSSSASPPLAS
jgi:malate dehydrogenase (oxaloacetate-decarboxylating)(NADP+)